MTTTTICDHCGRGMLVNREALHHRNCVLAICDECGGNDMPNDGRRDGPFHVTGPVIN